MGSFTLSTMSATPQTSSASARMVALLGDELLVTDRGADPGTGLDVDLMPMPDELGHAHRRDGHAVLVVLDLARDTDLHDDALPS